MKNPQILVVMGSDSDLPVMRLAAEELKRLDIEYVMTIASAHRSPDRLRQVISQAERDGVKIIIAAAGGAAHLAGSIAALTVLPVIGVPLANPPLSGVDSLYSTVQMPAGVPVATMAIGEPGARNAAIFAAEILALTNSQLMEKLRQKKEELSKGVEEKAKRLNLNY